jgi:hypothetical protein
MKNKIDGTMLISNIIVGGGALFMIGVLVIAIIDKF